MASVTKALASSSGSATVESTDAQTYYDQDEKPPEYSQVPARKTNRLGVVDASARRARYYTKPRRNFLGLLMYNYSEWEDQAIAASSSRGR